MRRTTQDVDAFNDYLKGATSSIDASLGGNRGFERRSTRTDSYAWPGQLVSGEVASRACPGNVWTVSSRPNGTTIELARRVFDPVHKPLIRELSLRSVRLVPVPGATRR